MTYYVVEKDLNSMIGFIYPKGYDDKKKAQEYADKLAEKRGIGYYDIFVAEMEE